MFTTEQKAWQLHENGVDYGAIYSVQQRESWDEYYNPNGPLTFTADQAIELLWEEMFGKK